MSTVMNTQKILYIDQSVWKTTNKAYKLYNKRYRVTNAWAAVEVAQKSVGQEWLLLYYSFYRLFVIFFYISSESDQRENFPSSSYCLCSSSYFFCWLYMLSCLQIGINVNILAPLQNVGGKESSATTPLLTERRFIRLELCGTISHAWMGLVF